MDPGRGAHGMGGRGEGGAQQGSAGERAAPGNRATDWITNFPWPTRASAQDRPGDGSTSGQRHTQWAPPPEQRFDASSSYGPRSAAFDTPEYGYDQTMVPYGSAYPAPPPTDLLPQASGSSPSYDLPIPPPLPPAPHHSVRYELNPGPPPSLHRSPPRQRPQSSASRAGPSQSASTSTPSDFRRRAGRHRRSLDVPQGINFGDPAPYLPHLDLSGVSLSPADDYPPGSGADGRPRTALAVYQLQELKRRQLEEREREAQRRAASASAEREHQSSWREQQQQAWAQEGPVMGASPPAPPAGVPVAIRQAPPSAYQFPPIGTAGGEASTQTSEEAAANSEMPPPPVPSQAKLSVRRRGSSAHTSSARCASDAESSTSARVRRTSSARRSEHSSSSSAWNDRCPPSQASTTERDLRELHGASRQPTAYEVQRPGEPYPRRRESLSRSTRASAPAPLEYLPFSLPPDMPSTSAYATQDDLAVGSRAQAGPSQVAFAGSTSAPAQLTSFPEASTSLESYDLTAYNTSGIDWSTALPAAAVAVGTSTPYYITGSDDTRLPPVTNAAEAAEFLRELDWSWGVVETPREAASEEWAGGGAEDGWTTRRSGDPSGGGA